MPRKTTILIVILALITGVLIFLAVRSDNTLKVTTTTTPTPTTVQPYATLSFSKPVIDVSTTSAAQTVDILIDTNNLPAAGAQAELTYDPKVITNVRLVPSKNPFFGANAAVLINTVDPTQGRISYAVGISPDASELTGKGILTGLSFTVNKSAGVASSTISFISKSAVTTLRYQGSVLKDAMPLQVTITKATTPTP